MKRALAAAYFAALCVHCALWLRMWWWPRAASPDALEMLGILVVAASPLIFLAALLGLVAPRKPVAWITGLVVLSLFAELMRAAGNRHSSSSLEGVIAAASLLLGVVGILVVASDKRKAQQG